MRKLLIMPLLIACTTYQSYVNVDDLTFIPDGSKEIILKTTIDNLLNTLTDNTIHYYLSDNGAVTEEILIDDGTRAQYKLYFLDDQIKIIPYWGYTQKVINQAQIIGGYETANFMSKDLNRVVYNKNELRPKKVFDYGVMLARQCGQYEIN